MMFFQLFYDVGIHDHFLFGSCLVNFHKKPAFDYGASNFCFLDLQSLGAYHNLNFCNRQCGRMIPSCLHLLLKAITYECYFCNT